VPLFDLTEDDRAILAELLRETINRDRIFPLPPLVLDRAKAILARLDMPEPTPGDPMPPR
jgi:hypothetical protein